MDGEGVGMMGRMGAMALGRHRLRIPLTDRQLSLNRKRRKRRAPIKAAKPAVRSLQSSIT